MKNENKSPRDETKSIDEKLIEILQKIKNNEQLTSEDKSTFSNLVELKRNKNEIHTLKDYNNCFGTVLRIGLFVEHVIENSIETYLMGPTNPKKPFLDRTVINPLGFEKKIILLQEICRREKLLDIKTKKIIKEVHEIRLIRNKIAHGDSIYYLETDELRVQKRRDEWDSNDAIKLDEEFAEKFKKGALI